MEELYQIYLITDLTNDKKYIGQVVKHRGYLRRFKEHLNDYKFSKSAMLSNAINKHGEEKFKVDLIEDNILEHDIDEKEKYYIKKYDTHYSSGKGYNITYGDQGVHGYKHTDEDIKKISATSKILWEKLYQNPEKLKIRNKKISEKLSGKTTSIETKIKLSLAAKQRFKNSHGTFYGKKHTENTKNLIAEKNGYRVGMYDKKSGELIKTFVSMREAAKYLIENNKTKNKSADTRIATICNHVKGQGQTAYGYKWEFLK